MNSDADIRILPSTPKLVRFFEDRAEVTRQVVAPLAAGCQWLRISGVTPLVDDRSVQAACAGAKILAARVFRRLRTAQEISASEIEKFEREGAKLQARIDELRLQISRVEKRLEYLGALFETWTQGIAKIPRFSDLAPMDSWTSAYDELLRADGDEMAHWLKLTQDVERLEQEQAELGAQASGLGSQQPRCETFIDVQLDAPAATEREITLIYRTPGALWRPEHFARLDVDAKQPEKGKVTLQSFAAVWQRTGESWENVQVAFSTARPAQVATPPLLSDDALSKRKRAPEEKKKVVVEMREQAIETARTGKAPEMPGVDDGGEPLEFTGKSPLTLASTGTPMRVEIARLEVAAEVARILMPERVAIAHQRARCVNNGKTPLLAGPIRVARGASLVGRARLDFVGTGEPFDLGFGPEDGLRCRRTMEEKREVGLMGGQTITREVTLSLSNLGSQARPLEILERVPVSEIEGLEVRAPEPKEWAPDKDGFMKRTITLEPSAAKELKFKYELRAKSNVELPF